MTFDEELINTLKSIGFRLKKAKKIMMSDDNPGDFNISEEYRYNSPNLINSHYTMIVYKHNRGETNMYGVSIEYRLYIHSDHDGKFISSPFQVSSNSEYLKKYIMDNLQELFLCEFRAIKILEILN